MSHGQAFSAIAIWGDPVRADPDDFCAQIDQIGCVLADDRRIRRGRTPKSSVTCRDMLAVAVQPKRAPGPLGGAHQPSRSPRRGRCLACSRRQRLMPGFPRFWGRCWRHRSLVITRPSGIAAWLRLLTEPRAPRCHDRHSRLKLTVRDSVRDGRQSSRGPAARREVPPGRAGISVVLRRRLLQKPDVRCRRPGWAVIGSLGRQVVT